MSTKTSADMNITRPTTRVHVPPGGKTSISFGDASSTTTPAPSKAAAAAVAEEDDKAVIALQESMANAKIEEKKLKLTIILSGRTEARDAISAAVSKAIGEKNIVGAKIVNVPDFAMLPYVTQQFTKSSDAIIVSALLTSEFSNAAVYATSITSALFNLGVNSNTPIIPAILAINSLLEAKAVLPDLAAGWLEAIINHLDLRYDTAPVVPVEKKPAVVVKPGVSVDVLIQNLRDSLKAHGATGITSLGRKFRIIDDDKSGNIELSEFTKVLKEHGLIWTASQIKSVFDFFDKDKSGAISYDEFLSGVRGVLNDRRKQLVLEAFQILDSDKMGYVDVEHIEKKYDASKHPDVIAGKRTAQEILREFLEVFEVGGVKDGKLTFDEFVNYYGNISASIDLDDYFELMIRNAWHISGGEGWCANSSNRRVLVTHKDGRQTVEEIKNDLGMKADDKEAMIANLKAQGIKDVVSIDIKGSTDGPTPEAAAPSPTAKADVAAPAAGGRANNAKGEDVVRPGSAATGFNPRRAPGGKSTIQFG